jgi:hypothetical protein
VSLDGRPVREVSGAAQRPGLSGDEVIEEQPRFLEFDEDARLVSPLPGWRHIQEVSRELV